MQFGEIHITMILHKAFCAGFGIRLNNKGELAFID